jgi:hypothetical protein
MTDPKEIFGEKIKNPLDKFNNSYGDVNSAGGGLVGLISNLLKLVFVVAGIYTLINIVSAGIMYISAGEKPEIVQQAWNKILMSLIGLAIMAGAFIIVAIVSYVLFGDPMVILNPTIYGPGGSN